MRTAPRGERGSRRDRPSELAEPSTRLLPNRGDRGRTGLQAQCAGNDVVGNLTRVHVESRGETGIALECSLPTEIGQRPNIGQCRVGQRETSKCGERRPACWQRNSE